MAPAFTSASRQQRVGAHDRLREHLSAILQPGRAGDGGGAVDDRGEQEAGVAQERRARPPRGGVARAAQCHEGVLHAAGADGCEAVPAEHGVPEHRRAGQGRVGVEEGHDPEAEHRLDRVDRALRVAAGAHADDRHERPRGGGDGGGQALVRAAWPLSANVKRTSVDS
jgi:hypothetical protein